MTDEVWLVLQDVDSSSDGGHLPTGDPSPSVSILSFEGHRLLDTLKSFPLVGSNGVGNTVETPVDASPTRASTSTPIGENSGSDAAVDDDSPENGHRVSPSSMTPTLPAAGSSMVVDLSRTSPSAAASSPRHAVRHILSVQNHVWICDSAGFIHIYCALSYQPLLSFPVAASNKKLTSASGFSTSHQRPSSATPIADVVVCATRLLFVSAANQVFAALSDGNLVFCNVVAVGQHLTTASTDAAAEGTIVEHKWLAQTLMQVCACACACACSFVRACVEREKVKKG